MKIEVGKTYQTRLPELGPIKIVSVREGRVGAWEFHTFVASVGYTYNGQGWFSFIEGSNLDLVKEVPDGEVLSPQA